MHGARVTLAQFLIGERCRLPSAKEDLDQLILAVAQACRSVANLAAYGRLGAPVGAAQPTSAHGEAQLDMDLAANDQFLKAIDWSGLLAGILSKALEQPFRVPAGRIRGKYLLAVDPLDRSSNVDLNLTVGSVFSLLRAPSATADPTAADFLQPGTRQACAGYALYGPSTVLVMTVGRGVHGFTLDPASGEFMLTHPAILMPAEARELAVDASTCRFWEPAAKRYVDECFAGSAGPRGRDFNARSVASVVAETHHLLLRGGMLLYPSDRGEASREGHLQLLCAANPLAFIVEQAGGRASTGCGRVLDIVPTKLHQCTGLALGSRDEVERVEAYHSEGHQQDGDAPLFSARGLFRATG
ncbi:MAG: class 1 fructose-bisphosphatase [Alphaproteobacteria bacterium]|nr:class 1 fructose-bisphosphatase [Alphaproteobacteria bacterium]